MSNEPEEDLIEATIRRVAEAKAAREAAEPAGDAADPPAPELEEQSQPEAEPLAAAAVDTWPETNGSHAAPSVDEDLIEATIRRVAAARAAKEAEAAQEEESEAPAEPEATGPAIEMPVEEAVAPLIVPRPIHATVPQAVPHEPSGDGRWAAEVRALQQEVAAMQGMLRELQARVDAAYAIANASAPASREAAQDDDWDDAPQLSRLPLGQPPRPALLRNPTPMTATAEHLVEDADDAPELNARPEAPAGAGPKRGFDLLPKSYRVTVEDKRRGVDLVPLHRALLGMDGVKDMSLLSYSNGVAIISIEMLHDLDPEGLRVALARAMSRDAKVEVHNETTMVVKLAEE